MPAIGAVHADRDHPLTKGPPRNNRPFLTILPIDLEFPVFSSMALAPAGC